MYGGYSGYGADYGYGSALGGGYGGYGAGYGGGYGSAYGGYGLPGVMPGGYGLGSSLVWGGHSLLANLEHYIMTSGRVSNLLQLSFQVSCNCFCVCVPLPNRECTHCLCFSQRTHACTDFEFSQ